MAEEPLVTLREVTRDIREDLVELRVAESQSAWVASNACSLQEAGEEPQAVPKAIYAGPVLVGFLMYEPLIGEGHPEIASIYRLMIDRRYQGHGYGRAALEVLLSDFRSDRSIDTVRVCFDRGNEPAQRLYRSLGFQIIGQDEDGEVIAGMPARP